MNGTFFTLSSLRNGNLQNHNVTGTSIVINVPVNNTEYSCAKATADSEIFSDSIFVYIAGIKYLLLHDQLKIHTSC